VTVTARAEVNENGHPRGCPFCFGGDDASGRDLARPMRWLGRMKVWLSRYHGIGRFAWLVALFLLASCNNSGGSGPGY
jgi:hypothetical protein